MRADPDMARQIRSCEQHPGRFGVGSADRCEATMGPQVSWFLSRSQLDLDAVSHDVGPTVIVILTGLLMLVGTTFAGADWNSGSMSNQLLFEPRRSRVWAAKATAVLLVALVVSAVVLALLWAAFALLASSRGIHTAPHVTSFIRGESVRGVVLAGCAALGALALTMLFRSTVATLGVLFAVTLVASLVLAALGVSEQWYPHVNVAAWLLDGYQYTVRPPSSCGILVIQGQDCSGLRTVTLRDAGTYLGAFLALAVALSALSFRRRDVP
jgi:preprotein translocase subunit SecG